LAAEVVRLIEEQGRALSLRCGRGVRVVAVTARSKVKKRGLDLRGIAGPGMRWLWPTIPASTASSN